MIMYFLLEVLGIFKTSPLSSSNMALIKLGNNNSLIGNVLKSLAVKTAAIKVES